MRRRHSRPGGAGGCTRARRLHAQARPVELAAPWEYLGADEADETVGASDFQAMLTFASEHHLARLTFWSVNRDHPCPQGGHEEDSCSGIAQQPLQFSDLLAQYHG